MCGEAFITVRDNTPGHMLRITHCQWQDSIVFIVLSIILMYFKVVLSALLVSLITHL